MIVRVGVFSFCHWSSVTLEVFCWSVRLVHHFRSVLLVGLPLVWATMQLMGALLVIGWLTLSVTSRNAVSQEFNQARFHLLDVHQKELDYCWNVRKILPKVDSTEYTETLATFITNSTDRSSVLIIGGPKDSGKTTGIMFMSQAAIRAGYYM